MNSLCHNDNNVMTTLCDNDFYIELTKLDLLYQQLLSAKTFRIFCSFDKHISRSKTANLFAVCFQVKPLNLILFAVEF